ncbi:hypothetical protein C8Q78DRAFT_951998, partial [Trametes maxima]
QPFFATALVMVCVLQALAHINHGFASYVLSTVKVIVFGAMMMSRGSSPLSSQQLELLRKVPSDVRTAIRALQLEPDVVMYTAC